MSELGWHGFSSTLAFIRATLSLGVTIGGLLYAGLIFGLDQRYGRLETVQALQDAVSKSSTTASRVERDVAELKAALIEGQLYDVRIRQCQEAGELRTELGRRVVELQTRYAQISGRHVALPECSAL